MRGEIWTASGGKDYAGKPRPSVIVQDDRFDTDSVTLCAFTTDSTAAELFRVPVEPSQVNGLQHTSYLKADKIATLPRTKLGRLVGRLDDRDMMRLERAILIFLGLVK